MKTRSVNDIKKIALEKHQTAQLNLNYIDKKSLLMSLKKLPENSQLLSILCKTTFVIHNKNYLRASNKSEFAQIEHPCNLTKIKINQSRNHFSGRKSLHRQWTLVLKPKKLFVDLKQRKYTHRTYPCNITTKINLK